MKLCHIDKCKRYIARHCHYHAFTPFFVQDSLHIKTIPSWHVRFPLCFHNPSTFFLIIVQHFTSLSSFLLFFKWCFIISCSWWFIMFHGNTRWTDPSAELSVRHLQWASVAKSTQGNTLVHFGKHLVGTRWAPTRYKEGYIIYNSTYRAVEVTTALTHVFQAIFWGNDSIYN